MTSDRQAEPGSLQSVPSPSDPSRSAVAAAVDAGPTVAILFTLSAFIQLTIVGMLAPLLVELAVEFSSTVPAMGQLNAGTAIAWAPSAVLISPLSDRFGRRPLIIIGMLGLGLTTILVSLAPSIAVLFGLRLLGGVFGGAFGPSVNAAIVDYFPPDRRGQVLGFQAAGFSLAAVVGVPLVTAIAALIGWRTSFLLAGAAMMLLALVIARALPRLNHTAPVAQSHLAAYASVLRQPQARPLYAANLAERIASIALATYLPAFLTLRYGLGLSAVAALLSIVAVGALTGTLVGGRLANRPGRLRVFAIGQGIAGLAALPLLTTTPGVAVSAALGLTQSFAASVGRPPFTWLIGQLSTDRRGAVMGLYALTNQGGIVIGSAVGGLVLAFGGFDAVAALVTLGLATTVIIAARLGRDPA